MSSINEEYVLGWKDYGTNFLISFDSLLQGNELVDVQLVAEGHLIGAHRLVLSAMSPYFRNMFIQMPANQQAFVFLKDISKQTMEQLITFIYRGEVNVKQNYLDEFMNAAQALNIKGLADGDFSQSFVRKQSFSTLAGPSFDGSAYQTPDFNHPLGSSGVQYQSVQHSAQFTHYQQPMNKYPEQDDLTVENEYDGNYASNTNDDNVIEEDEMMDQWNDGHYETGYNNDQIKMKTNGTVAKRAKRQIDISHYDIVADIRPNNKGGENLFYENYKFNKNNGATQNGIQRWACSKQGSKIVKCRAAMSTMAIDGVTMLKTVITEHTHNP